MIGMNKDVYVEGNYGINIGDHLTITVNRGNITIEAKGGKIMLTRNGGLITLGGKFPRFTKRSPDGRLKELRTLLKAL